MAAKVETQNGMEALQELLEKQWDPFLICETGDW